MKILIYAKKSSLPRILIQQTGRVSDSHNSQIANRLGLSYRPSKI
jgi:hypothetical protein